LLSISYLIEPDPKQCMHAYPCGSGSETLILSPTQVVSNQNLVDGLLWIGKIDVNVAGRHKVDPPAGYIPHPINNNYIKQTTKLFIQQSIPSIVDTQPTVCSRLLICAVQEI
jgi:hypothetical protein